MTSNVEILISVIMEEAFQEAEAILEKAEREAASIREKSLQKRAELLRQEENSRYQSEVHVVKAKMVSQAEWQARMEVIQQKESIIESLLRAVKQEFLSLPRHPRYPLILKQLVIQGLHCLEGNEFTCYLHERDRALIPPSLVEELIQKTGKKISLDTCSSEMAGGVIVQRSDGRILYDNSLEAIFQRKQEEMRSLAAKHLFTRC
jgi:vacuolar-type H+-ATPase subunit E/Vma4